MGITPAEMLKESVHNRDNIFEVLSAVRAYPFTMKNKNGISFKPDDVINLIKNNIDPDGNLKRDISTNRIIDDTYGLRTALSTLAPKQEATQKSSVSQSERRSMVFSRFTEKAAEQTKSATASSEPQKTSTLKK